MAFLTGRADMVLNVQLGTFCSMMTGNLLWMLRAWCDTQWNKATYNAAVLASYGTGLVFYRQQQQMQMQTGLTNRRPSFLTIMAGSVILLFVGANASSHPSILSSSFLLLPLFTKWLPACLLSVGFAMINGVGSDQTGVLTYVITGHMTKLLQAVQDDRNPHLFLDQHLETTAPLRLNASVLGGFMGGAIFANLLRNHGSKIVRITAMGELAWVGILLGVLLMWKDAVSSTTTRTTSSISSTKQWKSWLTSRLPSLVRRGPPHWAIPAQPQPTASVVSMATSSSSSHSNIDHQLEDRELLNSSHASELVMNAPKRLNLNATLVDWASEYSAAALLSSGNSTSPVQLTP